MEKQEVKKNLTLPTPAKLILPVLVLMLCAGIAVFALIRPYEKISTYLNIAFMDDLGITPMDGLSGLEIVENEIDVDYSGKTTQTGKAVIPNFGEQYAVLECDAIDLKVPVYWGSNEALLEKGAVQTTSSAVAGSGGNAVIDAHVNTFFRDLNQMKVGDTVVLYTDYGKFTYEVKETVTFKNTDKKYVLPTEQEKLTLYTCEMQLLGASDQRIGVVCDCVEAAYYEKEQKEAAEE